MREYGLTKVRGLVHRTYRILVRTFIFTGPVYYKFYSIKYWTFVLIVPTRHSSLTPMLHLPPPRVYILIVGREHSGDADPSRRCTLGTARGWSRRRHLGGREGGEQRGEDNRLRRWQERRG